MPSGQDDQAWPLASSRPRSSADRAPGRPGRSVARSAALAAGLVLAVAASLAVFLTDDPQHLRLAVIAAAWAFVVAAFAAGRRRADRATAAAREAELRRTYELELEREVAARREYELELESELRRETEDAVRQELSALRRDVAALSSLGPEVARLSALREDVAELTALRRDVAALAALRADLGQLVELRADLGQLAELRADMGRLRTELTEQLSSEMLVERIVMRQQAVRMPAEQGPLDTRGMPALDPGRPWSDDLPPRELTGGWPAVRLDEPRETRHFEQVTVDRSAPATSWVPAAPAPPPGAAATGPAAPPASPPPPTADLLAATGPARSPAERSVTASPAAPPSPDARGLRRRHSDDPAAPDIAAAATVARPRVSPGSTRGEGTDGRGGVAPPVSAGSGPAESTGSTGVAEILARNGVDPPPGGRRRRRYRDEGDNDDVLSRVLGRS